jgi:hypothetical protein
LEDGQGPQVAGLGLVQLFSEPGSEPSSIGRHRQRLAHPGRGCKARSPFQVLTRPLVVAFEGGPQQPLLRFFRSRLQLAG